MPDPHVTICVLAGAGEPHLGECLASARAAVDQVLLGYTGPSDNAADLAGIDAQVVPVPWTRDFSAARNALLDAAGSGWALMLDADERLEVTGEESLHNLTAAPGATAYWVPVRSPAGGDETIVSHQVRLFRNLPEHRYEGALGERLPEAFLAETGPSGGIIIHHVGLLPGQVEQRSLRNLAIVRGVPREPALALARGMQLLRLGFLEQAEAQFAAAEDPGGIAGAHLLRWRAHGLRKLGRLAGLLSQLEEDCRSHPAYTDRWFLYGLALVGSKRHVEAAPVFRRCLDMGPAPLPYDSLEGVGDALPLAQLGDLEAVAGRPAEAVGLYTQSYRARPGQTEPLYRIGAAVGQLNRLRELPLLLRKLVEPNTPDQWLLIADVLSVHRQYRAAIRCAETAARTGADPGEVAVLSGFCWLRLGDAGRAEAALAERLGRELT